MFKKLFILPMFLILLFPAFAFAAVKNNSEFSYANHPVPIKPALQISKISYYILLALLVVIVIFAFIVFIKKLRKKPNE